jgi:pimeloyl-ACP methyl ester carboxylesterase
MDSTLSAWKQAGDTFEYRGHSIFYRRDGRGPAVLAVHGYPLNSFDFSRVWSELCAEHEVIAPDMLGFGFSAKPADYPYSLGDLTDLHEALLAHLGISRVHLVAYDLGTAIAQELLARRQEGRDGVALESICFMNGSLFPEVYRPRFIQRLLSSPLGGLVGPRLPRGAVQRALASVFGPDTQPSADDLERFWELIDYADGRRVTHLLNRLVFDRRLHRDRWVTAMRETKIPLKLVNGPADPNSGAHMVKRYEELVPSPDVTLVGPRIGHWPTLEAPVETARAITAFWTRVEAAQARAK